MFLIDKIEPIVFLISLFVGLFFCYILTPVPEIIVKYPTPETASKLIFKDDADNCYKFISNEVECPNDKKLINNIPIQKSLKNSEI